MSNYKGRKGCSWYAFCLSVAGFAAVAVVTAIFFSRARLQHNKQNNHSNPTTDSPSNNPSNAAPLVPSGQPSILTPPAPAGARPFPSSSSKQPPVAAPLSSPAVPVSKYAEALKVTMNFFDIQKSGRLPTGFPISWRGNSALDDGSDAGLDLTGGLYDAGDHVKFGLPMAFTATILAWGILEYNIQYKATQQLDSAKDALKWITDYLIKAHPSSDEFFFQVGDPVVDHACWERAENIDISRPSYSLDPSRPGTEVAAETAAAMAAASLVFHNTDDPSYSQTLLLHAEELFALANNHRASYSLSFPSVQQFYNSTGYGDELLWAATWLYYATNNETYLYYATSQNGQIFAEWGQAPAWFSWDNKLPGVHVLLSRNQVLNPAQTTSLATAGLQKYKSTADDLMCAFLPDSPTATSQRTAGGMLWVTQWNSIQHAVNSAFIILLYSDYLSTAAGGRLSCSGKNYDPQQLREFAASQADYILGNNPMKMSYLVGYGSNFPKQVHHRGASIPMNSQIYACKQGFMWLYSPSPDPNVATGGLVGGPFQNDSFIDYRDNPMQNEPTTYNSAALASLLAGLSSQPYSVVPAFT
ncbi:hypothetical protein O6H91_05G090700 [Diphasiastrum complanatum]|uniref:Uncharacterized protein n=3 Tax=Diphasiastrum complanatum TaxID=34168 RepID=A0ACC2DQT3_DIPCM|nr:hypothetical protein O6H91_05G090600 [Diphasiastrum complanatum]KAJ7556623.1 hypothetical protein O6H91_05G090700 [Diphasiastrum complanatum]KAJ7556624.1 hypothetical protein O6H91_05G090700 [Diphasiastrum complanatum]